MSALPQFGRAINPAWRTRVTKGELYLVPQEMIPCAWRSARYVIQAPKMGIGRAYDIERLHGRLLLGIDRLWMAAFTVANKDLHDRVAGAVITSIGPMPKDAPNCLFDRKDRNSLTVHFIAGRNTEAWIADAVEKVARYGEENGCKQLFALARLNWMKYLHPLYDRFERVGLARDRMTTLGRNMDNPQQRPGHFRLLCRDLPRGMTWECARHQSRRVYMKPKKGEAHGNPINASHAGARASAAQ